MPRSPGRRPLARSLALVAGVLACAVLGLPTGVHAQASQQTSGPRLRVRLATSGTTDFLAPYALVSVSEPAYVAVFEVYPDVGALLLYPYSSRAGTPVRRSVSIDLADLRIQQYRQDFQQLAWNRFQTARSIGRGYMVAIASRRPLRIDRLELGRVYEIPGGTLDPYGIVDDLLALVLPPESTADWSYDLYGFFRNQEPALSYLMYAGPYAPYARGLWGYPGVGCYSYSYSFDFGFLYPGLPAMGCGAGAYGFYSPLAFGYGYGYGSPWSYYPWGWGWAGHDPDSRSQPRTAGPVDTRGMRVGEPKSRNRHPVVDGTPGSGTVAGKVAEGREKRVGVAGGGGGQRVVSSEPRAKTPPTVRDPEQTAERFRELLRRLGDAGSDVPVSPGTMARYRHEFTRAGLRAGTRITGRMELQGLRAERRLEERLQSMGIPAPQAVRAAGRSGGAPRVEYFGGGHVSVERHWGRPASASQGAAGQAPRTVHGSTRVEPSHVSRPAPPPEPRPVSRPAPRMPRSFPEPRPRASHAHGGGSGHPHGGGGA